MFSAPTHNGRGMRQAIMEHAPWTLAEVPPPALINVDEPVVLPAFPTIETSRGDRFFTNVVYGGFSVGQVLAGLFAGIVWAVLASYILSYSVSLMSAGVLGVALTQLLASWERQRLKRISDLPQMWLEQQESLLLNTCFEIKRIDYRGTAGTWTYEPRDTLEGVSEKLAAVDTDDANATYAITFTTSSWHNADMDTYDAPKVRVLRVPASDVEVNVESFRSHTAADPVYLQFVAPAIKAKPDRQTPTSAKYVLGEYAILCA